MSRRRSDDVTPLLAAWSAGDSEAEARLIPMVYGELRRIAGAHLRGERHDHTLQPTALVHVSPPWATPSAAAVWCGWR